MSGRSHFAFPYLVSFRVRMLGAFLWRGIWVQMCANRVHVQAFAWGRLWDTPLGNSMNGVQLNIVHYLDE